MRQTDEYWMGRALELAARAAELGEVPVGAIVVDADDEVLGEGWNSPISSNDPTAHAEVVALRAAGLHAQNYRLPGCRLYVTIEPCTMCAGALIHSRVSHLIYGATEPKSGVIESNLQILQGTHYNHQLQVTAGVLADDCSQIISDFFRQRRAAQKALKLQLN